MKKFTRILILIWGVSLCLFFLTTIVFGMIHGLHAIVPFWLNVWGGGCIAFMPVIGLAFFIGWRKEIWKPIDDFRWKSIWEAIKKFINQ